MTYEGSLTQPSCVETVQWIISNKPLYMSLSDLQSIRNTVVLEGQGEGNFRPTQMINSRSLRTNIPSHPGETSMEENPSSKYAPNPGSHPNNVYSNSKTTTASSEDSRVNQSINKKKLCSGRGFIAYKGKVVNDNGINKAQVSQVICSLEFQFQVRFNFVFSSID